ELNAAGPSPWGEASPRWRLAPGRLLSPPALRRGAFGSDRGQEGETNDTPWMRAAEARAARFHAPGAARRDRGHGDPGGAPFARAGPGSRAGASDYLPVEPPADLDSAPALPAGLGRAVSLLVPARPAAPSAV